MQLPFRNVLFQNFMVHCCPLSVSLLVNMLLSYSILPPTALPPGLSLWSPLTFFLPLVPFLINQMEFSVLYLPPAPQTFSDSSITSSWRLSLCPQLLLAPCPSQLLPYASKVGISPSAVFFCCLLMLLEGYRAELSSPSQHHYVHISTLNSKWGLAASRRTSALTELFSSQLETYVTLNLLAHWTGCSFPSEWHH